MTTATAAPKPRGFGASMASPAATPAPAAAVAPAKTNQFSIQKGKSIGPQKVLLYGSGGTGKTSLCEHLHDAGITPLFLDIERGSGHLDVARIPGDGDADLTFQDVLNILRDQSIWTDFNAVVIDSVTKLEELIKAHVIKTVPHEKNDKKISRIEDYGFGKGLTHIYDAFVLFLQELESHVRAGRHVVLVAHECISTVPNPMGEDFIRYEPRLQSPPSGKASVRHLLKEWVGHVFFIGYDVKVSSDSNKGIGAGTRSIYTQEMPTHWAKSRTVKDERVDYPEGDAKIWKLMLGKEVE